MSQHHLGLEGDFFQGNHPELHELATSDTQRAELDHAQRAAPSPSPSPSEARFYDEFKRIYLIAHTLHAEKHRLHQNIAALHARLRTIEGRLTPSEGRREGRPPPEPRRHEPSSEDNRKRSRRTAEEIEKKHQCRAHQCERYYGSEGSLQQHIKLKHPELLRRDDHSGDSDAEHDDEEEELSGLID